MSVPVGRLSRRGRIVMNTVVLGAIAIIVTVSPTTKSVAAEGGISEIPSASTNASGTLKPAIRLRSADPIVASAGPVPMVNTSTCRRDLPRPAMTMTIAEISYSCPVYAGGQQLIDAGAVTMINDPAGVDVLALGPGAAGTLWIAAHRSSHGGAFAAVPTLADGSIVIVEDETSSASYRIIGRRHVQIRDDMVVDATGNATTAATLEALIRSDHGGNKAPRLVLQTCDGTSYRWMIYADLITR
jgi:sortase (surface protein transpeptidase)